MRFMTKVDEIQRYYYRGDVLMEHSSVWCMQTYISSKGARRAKTARLPHLSSDDRSKQIGNTVSKLSVSKPVMPEMAVVEQGKNYVRQTQAVKAVDDALHRKVEEKAQKKAEKKAAE